MAKFILALTCLLATSTVVAHPVSFKGSAGLMFYQSTSLSHQQLNYSGNYWWAAGIHNMIRDLDQDQSAQFVSANFLVKRWNKEALQANLYASLGVGQSHLNLESPDKALGLGIVQFDIEDRDYYFLAKSLNIGDSETLDLQQNFLRLGFTPYVDPYEGIHAWLIMEWQSMEYLDGTFKTSLTPFLRVFYRNLLVEFGQSFQGETRLNFITHL
jgi:hypothetical protein